MMRGRAGGVFIYLGPYEFRWIEFWRTGRELVHMQARMLRQKIFHFAAPMNRMLIPKQHQRACDVRQHMDEKANHLLTADRFTVRLKVQLDLAPRWRYRQDTNQVQALIVFKAGTNRGRLSVRCPSPFERRNQRKPAFIEEN